ncbi:MULTISPECIES: Hsp20/alpha crystallin family protein [Bacillus]|uniref:Hsp20/alpha crystallin family protein n=1 Tax=Bacillus TaxID=1386 RepID=UPI000468C73E|nr:MULTISPECIES: Hsp20/alpha crystallin family protein [Bacillus]MED1410202.1 Hsp20/alpha crystallin family protein [Bacillus paramycoides]MED1464716.1 Hsp20/alpha crystallin family protein [Bacillus paramycoides]MED1493243.1 Hsp20/alpha crystallin family protein [Bacillus paramycoides]
MSEEKKDSSRPPVRNYLKQIDDFFEQTPLRNVIADLNHFFQKGNRLLTFPVDLYEVGDELVVTAELPGIQKEQIQIEIQSEYLKVSVKEDIIEETEEQTSHNYYRRERSSSEASRIIKLPYLINKKTAKASYQNGVLEIRAPKLPQQHDILSID